MRNFAEQVSKNVGAELTRRGFIYGTGVYRRRLSTGIVHGIGFDNRGRNELRFRVMAFVNASDLDGDTEGGYLVRYFTGGSMSDVPRDLPCDSEAKLQSSISRLLAHLDATIEPFFAKIGTPSALAAALAGEANLDFYRAQLLVLDGNITSARVECDAYIARLEARLGSAHPDYREARARVEELLRGALS